MLAVDELRTEFIGPRATVAVREATLRIAEGEVLGLVGESGSGKSVSMLATLGMECSNPMSIRYVRGVFFQGMPLIDQIDRGADPDWTFPELPRLRELAEAAR